VDNTRAPRARSTAARLRRTIYRALPPFERGFRQPSTAWLTDVLTKLVNLWPASRIDELMPWHYAAKRD
jgi:hypothetical protein